MEASEWDIKLRTALLDAATGGASNETLRQAADAAGIDPKATDDEFDEAIADLVSAGQLVPTDAGEEGSFRRPLPAVIAARIMALGDASKDGTTVRSLEDVFVTPGDLKALEDLILVDPKGGGVSLALKADDRIWARGARAFCAALVVRPDAATSAAPVSALRQQVLDAIYESDDWMTTDDVQESVNRARAAAATKGGASPEHVAIQQVDEELSAMFHEGVVDSQGEEPRTWREATGRQVARRAAIIDEVLSVGTAETASLSTTLGVSAPAIDADVGSLSDAGLVELGDGVVAALRDGGGISAIGRFVASEVVRSQRGTASGTDAQANIKEIALWREKHATERRAREDLASWLHSRGYDESDVLDDVRGIVRRAQPKTTEFDWTESRSVDQAEKGTILGEIIELENQIAHVRLEMDVAASGHKGKVKGLEAAIKELKNGAGCNTRVVSIRAYRETDWEDAKVYVRAVEDGRELAIEDLPKGSQRPIPGIEREATPAVAAAVDAFVGAMEAKGAKVTGGRSESVPQITITEPRDKPRVVESMEHLERLIPSAIEAHVAAFGLGITEEQLVLDLEQFWTVAVPAAQGQGALAVDKAVKAGLLRLRKAGRVEGPGGGWKTVAKPAEDLGPLASSETRQAHQKKGRKSKAEATAP